MKNLVLKSQIIRDGFTVSEVALQSGITAWRMSRIISGYENPRSEEKQQIARVLNVPVDKLFPPGSSERLESEIVKNVMGLVETGQVDAIQRSPGSVVTTSEMSSGELIEVGDDKPE